MKRGRPKPVRVRRLFPYLLYNVRLRALMEARREVCRSFGRYAVCMRILRRIISRLAYYASRRADRLYALFRNDLPGRSMTLEVSADRTVWKPLVYTGASVYNTWAKTSVGFYPCGARLATQHPAGSDGCGPPVRAEFRRYCPDGRRRRSADRLRCVRQGVPLGRAARKLGGSHFRPGDDLGRLRPSIPTGPARSAATRWSATTPTATIRAATTPFGSPIRCAVYGGGFDRTSPDPWAPDPALDASYQSKIYPVRRPERQRSLPVLVDEHALQPRVVVGDWTRGHLCLVAANGAGPIPRSTGRPSTRPTSLRSPTLRPVPSARFGNTSKR